MDLFLYLLILVSQHSYEKWSRVTMLLLFWFFNSPYDEVCYHPKMIQINEENSLLSCDIKTHCRTATFIFFHHHKKDLRKHRQIARYIYVYRVLPLYVSQLLSAIAHKMYPSFLIMPVDKDGLFIA